MANIKIYKCNIYKQQCQLILHNGESECKHCNGHGGFFSSAHPKDRYYKIRGCMVCNGEGKLDWITNVIKIPKSIPELKAVNMKCPSSRGHKCKIMKRLWKQEHMKCENY